MKILMINLLILISYVASTVSLHLNPNFQSWESYGLIGVISLAYVFLMRILGK